MSSRANFEIIESLDGETAIGCGVGPLADGFEPETQTLTFLALLDAGPFRDRPISGIRPGPGVPKLVEGGPERCPDPLLKQAQWLLAAHAECCI